jgi:AcrR family transcriptional regulator
MCAKIPNSQDRRVQQTNTRLREAFISLVRERGYEAVAIRDVVERAGVGRSTFYTHFGDLEELHEQWLKDFSAQSNAGRPLLDFAHSFLEHAKDRRGAWHGLGRKRGGASIQRRFRQHLLALAQAEVKQIVPRQRPAVIDATSRYLAGGFAEVLFWWIEGTAKISHAEVDEIFHRLTKPILDAIRVC